jgi:mRNA-degrading endonuclease YafQ of YafQ-DinJ toxin-antitoxin module
LLFYKKYDMLKIDWSSEKIKKKVQKMAEKNRNIAKKMTRISAAKNFTDIEIPQNGRAHFLTGNYKGYFAIDIEKKTSPVRLICKPINGEKDESGSYIKETITKIEIIKIEKDYH